MYDFLSRTLVVLSQCIACHTCTNYLYNHAETANLMLHNPSYKIKVCLTYQLIISPFLPFNVAGNYCWSNCPTVQMGWWWSEASFCCYINDSSIVISAGLLNDRFSACLSIYLYWIRNWVPHKLIFSVTSWVTVQRNFL